MLGVKLTYRTLGNTGIKTSVLSYGASSLGSVFRNINELEGIRTVHIAIDSGINLIDCSPYYGLTSAETVLGKALKEIPRDKYYLSTKTGRYDDNTFDFSAKRINQSIEESMARLGVTHFDFYHLHDIEFVDLNQIIDESLPALHELKEQGKIRFYGVTGLPLKIFTKILQKHYLDVILSYCHYSLNDTSLLYIVPILEKKGIGIINASPTGMGLFNLEGPPSWHPAPEEICSRTIKAVEFCKKHKVNSSHLALRFAVNNPDIHTTLVGTASPKNMLGNIKILETPLDLEFVKKIQKILAPIRDKSWLSGLEENN